MTCLRPSQSLSKNRNVRRHHISSFARPASLPLPSYPFSCIYVSDVPSVLHLCRYDRPPLVYTPDLVFDTHIIPYLRHLYCNPPVSPLRSSSHFLTLSFALKHRRLSPCVLRLFRVFRCLHSISLSNTTAVPMLLSAPPPQIAPPLQCTHLAWHCPFLATLIPPLSLAWKWRFFPYTLTPPIFPISLTQYSLSLLSLSWSLSLFIYPQMLASPHLLVSWQHATLYFWSLLSLSLCVVLLSQIPLQSVCSTRLRLSFLRFSSLWFNRIFLSPLELSSPLFPICLISYMISALVLLSDYSARYWLPRSDRLGSDQFGLARSVLICIFFLWKIWFILK